MRTMANAVYGMASMMITAENCQKARFFHCLENAVSGMAVHDAHCRELPEKQDFFHCL
ncbi:hypothetical protein OROMI_003568 [Orobanche minor]